MARPKKHVRIICENGAYKRTDRKAQGQEITGLHFNKSNQSYYHFVDGNKVWLGRDLREALRKYGWDEPTVSFDDVKVVGDVVPTKVSEEVTRKLALEAVLNAFGPEAVAALENTFRQSKGYPEEKPKVHHKGTKRLSHVLEVYKEGKIQANGGTESPHCKEVCRVFETFIKVAGNRYVTQLEYNTFRTWHNWVAKESEKKASNKWGNDFNARIKAVIKYAKRKTMDWDWPVEVLEWADAYDHHAYAPKTSNCEPMPVEVFRAYVAAAEKRIALDPHVIPADTQSGRGRRLQAGRSKREGYQLRAALWLGLNAAFDPIDLSRLRKENLHLEEDLPYVDLPRSKVAKRVGQPIKRCCPLMPQTVQALQDWLAYEQANDEMVFRNCQGRPYARSSVSNGLSRLRKEAGSICDGWSFKHLRNVGPTVGRFVVSNDLLDAFLGHQIQSVLKHYTGKGRAEAMLPIVKAIEERYLSQPD